MNNSYEPFVQFLKGARQEKILIVTHRDPDGDGLSCCLALSNVLNSLNIENCVWIPQGIPNYLEFLIDPKSIRVKYPDYFSYTAVIALDCSSLARIPELHLIKDVEHVINIDHHQDNQSFGKINLLEDRSSVGEILSNLFLYMHHPLNKEIANYLYAAIVYDTGQFRHSNTSASTLKLASILVDSGAENNLISRRMFEDKSSDYFIILRKSLERVVLDKDTGIVYTSLLAEDLTEKISLIDIFRQWKACKVAMIFQEIEKNEVKISLRSEEVNVAEFARKFGGGGHKKAAGIRLHLGLEEAIEKVVKALEVFIQ